MGIVKITVRGRDALYGLRLWKSVGEWGNAVTIKEIALAAGFR